MGFDGGRSIIDRLVEETPEGGVIDNLHGVLYDMVRGSNQKERQERKSRPSENQNTHAQNNGTEAGKMESFNQVY